MGTSPHLLFSAERHARRDTTESRLFRGEKLFNGVLYLTVGIYLTVIANGSMNGG